MVRPKDNQEWKGYSNLTKGEVEILSVMENHWKNTKQGLTIKRIARQTDFHKVSVSNMLNDMKEEGIVKKINTVWVIKDKIKGISRVVLNIPESFREDLEIKAIKEKISIEEYIIKILVASK
jgi:DNA-binding Lrp family transcriptional regulator